MRLVMWKGLKISNTILLCGENIKIHWHNLIYVASVQPSAILILGCKAQYMSFHLPMGDIHSTSKVLPLFCQPASS